MAPPTGSLVHMRLRGSMIVFRRRPLIMGLAAIVMAAALAGCAGFGGGHAREDREARVNKFPENYKTDLLAALHAYVADPTNIRDAYLTDPPAIMPISPAQNRYAVCVRFNAKNSDGRYTGSRDVMAVFVNGRFDRFVDQVSQASASSSESNPVKEQCGQADYKRFPELEALTH
jgi:hypothetical protein